LAVTLNLPLKNLEITTFDEAAGMQVTAPTAGTNVTAPQANNNANPFAGRGVTLGSDPTPTGNMGFSSQQQVFDHLQTANTNNIAKEKGIFFPIWPIKIFEKPEKPP
jgi:hypothetical protein